MLQLKMDITSDELDSSGSDESFHRRDFDENDVHQKLAWVFDSNDDPAYLRQLTRFLAGIS